MKRDIFQENYKVNPVKVLFADLVVFLLVTIFSVGFCYSYFSDKVEVTGNATTAMVTVAYRTNYADGTNRDVIYGNIEDGAVQNISSVDLKLTPGDTLYIRGYAVNTSNVSVYVLARLDVTITETTVEGSNEIVETYWYNIVNNKKVAETVNGQYPTPVTRYTIGASSLAPVDNNYIRTDFYQQLSIPYKYDDKYTNAHTITNIKLTLTVHQKDYLRMCEDFSKYSVGEVDGKLGAYDTESIYASHQMTGEFLS